MVLPKIIYIFIFTSFSDWEIGYVSTGINNPMMQIDQGKYKVKTFSIDGKPVVSMGGLKITPDMSIEDVTFSNAEMLILPGGAIWENKENKKISSLAEKFHNKQIKVAAICGATLGLAKKGMLDDVKHTSNSAGYLSMSGYKGMGKYLNDLVANDQGIITASGTAPLEFAYEVFKELNLYKPQVLKAWYELFKTGSPKAYEKLLDALES